MSLKDSASLGSEEFRKITLDAIEESADTAWHSLIHNLSEEDLEKLQSVFKRKCGDDVQEIGLTPDEFQETICAFYGPQYSLQAKMLSEEICKNGKDTFFWNDFLDFLIEHMCPEAKQKLSLSVGSIEGVAHTKNESVAKIVPIETDQYFCYAIILKHGRVGLYDGNLNFLTSYHAIMTRKDLQRPEDERRRRNRWITDAIFCPDTLMFIVTNTARSIMIYEASGLKHMPYWLILSTPNIFECLSYEPFTKLEFTSYSQSILFSGDSNGNVTSFTFCQPKNGLLRRKRTDDITLFYWDEFVKEEDYVIIKTYRKIHGDSIKHIQYFDELKLLLTCSNDPEASVAIKHMENKRKTCFYKVPGHASCFAFSPSSKILITGSVNGIIRLWNTFIAKPVALFSEHQTEVVDIQIIESQDLFFSCSVNGVLKLWDLKEYTCLQTIKLKFPSFRIHGKLIEWGINCIFPGPKREQPLHQPQIEENKRDCFGIQDIIEMRLEFGETAKKANIWERSCILITCCNHIAVVRTNFSDASIEYSFTYPILPPPPLQNSVLIPSDWGLQSDTLESENKYDEKDLRLNIEKQLEDIKFILDKSFLEKDESKNYINYKIAILESKKELMRSKVAMGSPYLALDIQDISELKLSENLTLKNRKKSGQYMQKIAQLLNEAAYKDHVFLSPETSYSTGRSIKSSRSSIVEFPY